MGSYTFNVSNLSGTYGFSSGQTAMPYAGDHYYGRQHRLFGANHIGLPYASFLLGAVDTAEIDPPSSVRFGKQEWAGYVPG